MSEACQNSSQGSTYLASLMIARGHLSIKHFDGNRSQSEVVNAEGSLSLLLRVLCKFTTSLVSAKTSYNLCSLVDTMNVALKVSGKRYRDISNPKWKSHMMICETATIDPA